MQISLALILHNFPEGLAMFAAAMVSSRTGTIFGIALALHKIPEGIMISLPIAVATGSRWKGFLASAIIGTLAQFLGALLGYFLLRTRWTGAVSGSLFSIVTGMLLYTVVGNMLPLARQLDQQDRYVTIWTLTGVVVFALINSVFSFS
ncbi:Zinc/iron permease [Thamnocephalis sphaerospora]|uniref:Zinc/iron permease n=1 Tax=Thamnocephalis sphaerospora TaxID=78915 RepID=A0A4P9XPG9_9FUNG|nr:Zinc/iron permease [Thamnocephalis sphaerospora]|eukprot:RKP07904.1 Zinc/iron permease [Thamnocephalis sphaerospora]